MDVLSLFIIILIVIALVFVNLKIAESVGLTSDTNKWFVGIGTVFGGVLVTFGLIFIMIIQIGTGNFGKH